MSEELVLPECAQPEPLNAEEFKALCARVDKEGISPADAQRLCMTVSVLWQAMNQQRQQSANTARALAVLLYRQGGEVLIRNAEVQKLPPEVQFATASEPNTDNVWIRITTPAPKIRLVDKLIAEAQNK